MQERNGICYESQKLNKHERNDATHDLELETIVHAFKMWRHYLLGRKFELRMNHMISKCLFNQSSLNTRQAKWMELLCEFDFNIKHEEGKKTKSHMH